MWDETQLFIIRRIMYVDNRGAPFGTQKQGGGDRTRKKYNITTKIKQE
jgi:hypothetical protein